MNDKIKKMIATEGLFLIAMAGVALLKALYDYNHAPDLFGFKSDKYSSFILPNFFKVAAVVYGARFVLWAVKTVRRKE